MLIPFTTGAAQIYLMFSQNELWETGKYSDYSSRSLGDMRFLNDTIDVFMMLEVGFNQNKTLIIHCKRKVAKTLLRETKDIHVFKIHLKVYSN